VEALSTFHRVLADRRERYNQQFRLARHNSAGLDPKEFLTHRPDHLAQEIGRASCRERV